MLKNKKNLLPFFIFLGGLIVSAIVLAQSALAEPAEVVFPVKELGNCKNESECRSFCDVKENMIPCVNFAEKQGMMSKEDAQAAKKAIQISKGPGGCKNQQECAAYCEDIKNLEACLTYASQNSLMTAEQVAEAQKIAKALKEGAQLPGSCKNKSECDNYCNVSEHMEECLNFAEKADLIPPEELKEAKMAVAAMKAGHNPPGGCKGKKECDAFCSNPDNIEECMNFAAAAGFIPPEELEQAKKIIPLMKAGKMPGNCKNKQECEAFCADDKNMEVCANFAIEAGFMSKEDAEMYRKTGGKGPGNCKSKEACEAYCNLPENSEACLNFALEKGLVPEEQVKEMREGAQKFKDGLGMTNPEVIDCIKNRVGADKFEKMQTGAAMPSREAGQAMGDCFQSVMSKMIPPGAGGGAPAGAPGGMTKPPTAEDIQKMLPAGVEVTPEMMKKGPPSQQDIQNMIQQKVQEEMQKQGLPAGRQGAPSSGQTAPSSGMGMGGPVPASGSMPSGAGGPPSAEDIQKMIPKNIPSGGPPAGIPTGPPANIPSGGPPAGF